MKRWVVRAGDGATVAEIVAKAREPLDAVGEGRVFVGKKRIADANAPVRVGDEVKIGPARASAPLVVLWERDGLIAVDKPAGLPTVPDHEGSAQSLVALVSARTRVPNVRVTSRLDREVSGVVIFALTEDAEARLRAARERGDYTRRYLAIAERAPSLGAWDQPIGRGRDPRHRAVNGADPKAAHTRWHLVARAGEAALLAVEPQTGRTHQIRVHSAHAGAPLLGDRDYGASARIALPDGAILSLPRIALHAARVRAAGAEASAAVPEALRRAWTELGGAPEAWDTALACSLDS